MESAIHVQSLSVSIERGKDKVDLVQDVSFLIEHNQTLAVIGESGSGKTTLAHALLRLHSQKNGFRTRGSVLFANENLLTCSEKRLQKVRGAKIAIICQDPATSLNPVFSIGSQIAEVFELHGVDSFEEIEAKTFEALREVGLQGVLHPFHTYPHQLSGGMKQRVMIAMAIAMRPKVLIADEPTSALDLTVQKEILELLKKYREDHSMAFLLITHDFNVVRKMADFVAVMYKGEFVEQATVQELFDNPVHPYTQALLSARLTRENRKQKLAVFSATSQGGQESFPGCPFQLRCPKMMKRCCEEKVPYFSLSATHKVRCWLHEEHH